MPKDTYFHLPEAKQKRIFDAAMSEIISVPIREVSINRIVQKAEISRGSFYQYFEDKQDLIMYALRDGIRFVKGEIDRHIRESHGDIFQAATQILEGVFSVGKNEVYRNTLRNVLLESNAGECGHWFLLQLQLDILDLMERKMDKDMLTLENPEEFHHLAKLIFVLLKEAAISYLYDGKDVELHREEFASQINMMKKGVLK